MSETAREPVTVIYATNPETGERYPLGVVETPDASVPFAEALRLILEQGALMLARHDREHPKP